MNVNDVMCSLNQLLKGNEYSQAVELGKQYKNDFKVSILHELNFYKLYLMASQNVDFSEFMAVFFELQTLMLDRETLISSGEKDGMDYLGAVAACYDSVKNMFLNIIKTKVLSVNFNDVLESYGAVNLFNFSNLNKEDDECYMLYARMLCWFFFNRSDPSVPADLDSRMATCLSDIDRIRDKDSTTYVALLTSVRAASHDLDREAVALCEAKLSQA